MDVKVPFLNNVKFGCVDSGCFNLKDGNKEQILISVSVAQSLLQHVRDDVQHTKLPVVLTRCPGSRGHSQCLQGTE